MKVLDPMHRFVLALARRLLLLSLWRDFLALSALCGVALCSHEALAAEQQGVGIPTGLTITPDAAKGAIYQDLNPGHPEAPEMRAGQATAVAVSPDGKLLAILTTGFNVYYGEDGRPIPKLSTEYVFLFDIAGSAPRQIQVLPLTTAFEGLAWAPSSNSLFASGGSDDTVIEFVRNGTAFTAGRTFRLGHKDCVGLSLPDMALYWQVPPGIPPSPLTRRCGPLAGSLAVSPDGTRLLVANLQNDSVSLIDLVKGQVVAEQDLRPGIIDPKRHGQSGGSFPRSVVWSSSEHAYVASERDREIISLRVSHDKMRVVRRMPVRGQPLALLANRGGSRLYATVDTADRVVVFDTASDRQIESVDATAPESVYANRKMLGGANPNALALTPDEATLLVSNGGQNSVAVLQLSDLARGVEAGHHKDQDGDGDDDDDGKASLAHSSVVGLIPTGRYPTGVATSKNGATWFVVNYKSATGPNVRWCQKEDPPGANCLPEHWSRQEVGAAALFDPKTKAMLSHQNTGPLRLEKAGFLTLPAPAPLELARLTKVVAHNNHFDQPGTAAADAQLFSFLRQHIKHVIYIVKENKTYDEVLGDLGVGNGDPRLTYFPERITPNHHAIAQNFVALDNFLVTGAGSWTGWEWSVSAQNNDYRERSEGLATGVSVKFDAGMQDEPGLNRNLNMAYATNKERKIYDPNVPSDPDILPGIHDVAAPDGPGGEEGQGYIWVAALHQGRTVRNWGFFGGFFNNVSPPFVRDPYTEKRRVFFPVRPGLMAFSDPYYRSFDPAFPDYWRVQEWKREFAKFTASKSAPNLMLVQLTNDHTGDFAHAIDGVDTPDTQVADNDYALGLIIETVANSPFANDTLIISVEDDPLTGLDHADAFRSVALVVGPYVRQHAVVSNRYTTVSLVKTIEEVLGLEPMGLNDALAAPMSAVFDPAMTSWSYKAVVPDVLRTTKLPLPPPTHAWNAVPRHSAAYWSKAMAGQDFSQPDHIDADAYNRTLWHAFNGSAPYPAAIDTGAGLRTKTTVSRTTQSETTQAN